MATVKVLVVFNVADEDSNEWEESDDWGNACPEDAGYTVLQEIRRMVEHFPEGHVMAERLKF